MVELFVNSGDPDQTPHSAASDLGLHCLPVTSLGSSVFNGLILTVHACLSSLPSTCILFSAVGVIFCISVNGCHYV